MARSAANEFAGNNGNSAKGNQKEGTLVYREG